MQGINFMVKYATATVVYLRATWAIYSLSLKNKKKICCEKTSYIFSKKVFLIFHEMELSSPKISLKRFLIFLTVVLSISFFQCKNISYIFNWSVINFFFFYCFTFCFQSKKISYVFNCGFIYFFFQCKNISYIFNWSDINFFSCFYCKKISYIFNCVISFLSFLSIKLLIVICCEKD